MSITATRVLYVSVGLLHLDKSKNCTDTRVLTSVHENGSAISDEDTIQMVVDYVQYILMPQLSRFQVTVKYTDVDKTVITIPPQSYGLKLSQLPFIKKDSIDAIGKQIIDITYSLSHLA